MSDLCERLAHLLRRWAFRLHNPDQMSRIVLRHTGTGEELAWVHVLGDCCGHGVVSAWMVDTPIPGLSVMLMWEDNDLNNCNPHPDAPHGFDRNASHNEGRSVCDCEHWSPPDDDDPYEAKADAERQQWADDEGIPR